MDTNTLPPYDVFRHQSPVRVIDADAYAGPGKGGGNRSPCYHRIVRMHEDATGDRPGDDQSFEGGPPCLQYNGRLSLRCYDDRQPSASIHSGYCHRNTDIQVFVIGATLNEDRITGHGSNKGS